MSETSSSSRKAQASPVPGNAREGPAEDFPPTHPRIPTAEDDQPTVISGRPPMAPGPPSDSTYRILRGSLKRGDRLGHFDLVGYVGGGGMGRVFRAVDLRLGRTVALKVLSPEQEADEEHLLRFRNEAQSAARLDHENIARVYHVGEDRGLHYIVFEFVEGLNIRTLVERKGPLSLGEAVSYALQIAEALAHAADRDVVHRDIKPSNVLITPEGHVKLIDMGLARLRREDASGKDLTASGVTLGTFDYISPEQARDPRNADIRSDIYSLGCTFFYMLAGRPPFPEGTVLQKLLQHQGDQPPDIRQFRPGVPEDAARLLRKMLAKDPRHRYRHASELVEDLMAMAEQIGLRPVGPGGKIWVAPRGPRVSFWHRHLPWMAPIAALFCIVAVLHFWWSGSPRQEPDPSPFGPAAMQDAGGIPPSGDTSRLPPEPPAGDLPTTPGPQDRQAVEPPPATDATADDRQQPPPPEPVPAAVATDPTRPDALEQLITNRFGAGGLGFEAFGGGVSVADGTSRWLSVAPEAPSGQLDGAGEGADGSRGIGTTVAPAPQGTGLLIVRERPGAENEFPTLSAACSAAVDNDVIELRYSGRREERPIALANLDVTVRAGEGYEPVVVFNPDEGEIDPVKYPRSMFTVTDGRLTLVNVALELYLPRGLPADNWSLFETRGSQIVRLQRCSLLIGNASDQLTAYHPEVAFFRTGAAPGADLATINGGSAAALPVTLDLLDSVARGEAVFLCAKDLQPVHLIWENGLLVTTERLLSSDGGPKAPQPGQLLQIDLRHLTAVVRSGLCLMSDNQLNPYQLAAQIRCADGILMAGGGVAVIEQVGTGTLDDFRERIDWNGLRNFYERFDPFWTIHNCNQEPLCEPLTIEAWKLHWRPEQQDAPQLDRVRWKGLPKADRPVHTHTSADYALAESTPTDPNPPLGAAPHGRDVGMLAERLPPLPPGPLLVEEAGPPETSGGLGTRSGSAQ